MLRRLVLVLGLALAVAAPAGGQDPSDRRRALEEKIEQLRGRIAEANREEGVLTTEISAVTARVRGLQDDVGSASARVVVLERELTVHRNRLATLTQLLRFQTQRLGLLRREHAFAQRQLERRLIEIYQTDELDTVTLVLSASNVSELIDGIDYVNEINRQDQRIARQFARAKRTMAAARARTDRTRTGVTEITRVVEARTNEQRAERDRLLANQEALRDARTDKQATLASIRVDRAAFISEADALARQSAALAARIRTAQAAAAATPAVAPVLTGRISSSGFIWPVSGPVTSGFGWRWGRMHEGIDIAAPTGTPIAAAAAGTVIVAGWMGGYGNLTVIDHGGGISTAYAHQSALAAGAGQGVAQGQVIGYVGSTGHSTGPHLHFEVRTGGSATDPLGYL
jgi:murein DD-endopeptidase MepM/ murein hydrolase activator NlpD